MSSPPRIVVAIDLFLGDLARQGRRPRTLDRYRRELYHLADRFSSEATVEQIRREDYEQWLDRWQNAEPSTLASMVSLVAGRNGFSKFLKRRGYTDTDVAGEIPRPPRKRPEDLDVVTVSSEQVRYMLWKGTQTDQEFVCLAFAAFLGRRRAALARALRNDVDLTSDPATIRFVDKGDKVILQPIPDDLVNIIRAYDERGMWGPPPRHWLIPNVHPNKVKSAEQRSDKVIWETVRRVAERCGIRCHVHALRAAFAVRFDEMHPDRRDALQNLMAHSRPETTELYLRRRDKARAMETVRDLSWSSVPPSEAGEAHTGFEPVSPENAEPDWLDRKLAELAARTGRVRR
jgi:integrase